MNPDLLPYGLILLASAVISSIISALAWLRRPARGSVPFSVLVLGVAIWSLCDLIELIVESPEAMLFWYGVAYMGIVMVPAMWLVFVLEYTGRDRILTWKNKALLLIEPAAVIAMIWSNPTYSLFWSNISLDSSNSHLIATYGPGFWAHTVYSYVLMLAGIAFLLRSLISSPRLYSGQTKALILGAMIPLFANILSITRISPIQEIDLTSATFSISGIIIASALFRLGLLDLVPVAHSAIIEGMGDGVIIIDSQNRIVDLNPSAQGIIGKSREEAVGHPAAEVLSARSDLVERYWDTAQARDEIELAFGSSKEFFDMRIVPLRDGQGRLTGRMIVLHNITARKNREDELRWNEALLRSMAETSPLAFYVANSETDEISCFTHRFCQIWGLEEIEEDMKTGKVKSSDIRPHILPLLKDVAAFEALSRPLQLQDEKNEISIDEEIELKDGRTLRWVSSQISDHQERHFGRLHVFEDITHRRRAKAALEEREELYRSMFEKNWAVKLLINPESGKIIDANPAACEFYGYSISEMRDKRIMDINTLSQEEVIAQMAKAKSRDRSYFLFRHRLASGEIRDVEVYSSPIDVKGRTLLFSIVHDVSGHRRAKEELSIAKDELERRVLERTEELEKKNTEMERFIYTVSHDLRSPLVTIDGFAGLLRKDLERGDADKVKMDVQMIENGIRKMDHLLSDTLELSRIGRVVNPPEAVPFADLVSEAVSQASEKIRSRSVVLRVEQDMPAVMVDHMRIVEVLVNLIENSVKYLGDQNHPCIEIGCTKEDSGPVFYIKDNGMGIDWGQHCKVFDLFYKVDQTSEGSGAGLAIVKRIIEVHGGRVWVESSIGRGCTIFFTLPISSPKLDSIKAMSV